MSAAARAASDLRNWAVRAILDSVLNDFLGEEILTGAFEAGRLLEHPIAIKDREQAPEVIPANSAT